MTHQHKEKKLSGLRERNLAKTAPLAFCLYVFLKELHWQGTNKELVALVGNDPEKLTLIALRNKLLKLGYNTSHSNIRNLQRLNKYQLPAIFVNNELTAFVIYEDKNNGEILAKNYDGIFKLKSILQSGEIIKIKQESIVGSSLTISVSNDCPFSGSTSSFISKDTSVPGTSGAPSVKSDVSQT